MDRKKFGSYENFASVYDAFMDNVPYKEWSNYLIKLLHKHGIKSGILLDLGCGTGTMTEILANAGYDMIGIDNSEDMLQIATEKNMESDKNILYLCQDMRGFELYGTVEAVISICDSMNYITNEDDFVQVIRLVNNYLEKDGLFIFDLNTTYKYETILADNTFAEDRDDISFIWQNYYDKKSGINEYDLSLFLEAEDGRYDKYHEVHYQKSYPLDTIKACIEAGGMEFIAAYDAFTTDAPKNDSQRMYIIAREKYNPNKTYNH